MRKPHTYYHVKSTSLLSLMFSVPTFCHENAGKITCVQCLFCFDKQLMGTWETSWVWRANMKKQKSVTGRLFNIVPIWPTSIITCKFNKSSFIVHKVVLLYRWWEFSKVRLNLLKLISRSLSGISLQNLKRSELERNDRWIVLRTELQE